MAPSFDPGLLTLRDLSEEDIPVVLAYWFESPPGFVEGMGADLAKLPPRERMEAALRERCAANARLPVSKLNALMIVHDGRVLGFHTLSPLEEGDFGIFHAHLSAADMRGRGIAVHTYPKACRIFMDRFELPRILFKTPLQNIGALRVKEKLGIRCIGEEEIGFGVIRDGTRAKVFELTREELDRLDGGAAR